MSIWSSSLLLYIVKISGMFYKSPMNFNYWFNFGFLSLFFLILQIITGMMLAMFYNANIMLAYGAMLDMSNEIYYGWWLSYMHANGASFFFLCVYMHMFSGLYYGSFLYPSQYLWVSGSMIWVLMMATAFFGYILPWGQMSFWGAMVITSLLGSIPFMGGDILYLLWGSFSMDNMTLHSFYSLHYFLPFIMLMVTMMHFALLHEFGSNNPLGMSVELDNAPFMPYYGMKDAYSMIMFLFMFFIFVFFYPDKLGHSDNYIMANSLMTPPHMVPEWYFLPLYAVLSSVPNKLLGLGLILGFILCMMFLPFICKNFMMSSTMFSPFYGMAVWFFMFVSLLLGWMGSLPVMSPFMEMGQLLTFLYFFMLLVLFPFMGFMEKHMYYTYVYSFYESNNMQVEKAMDMKTGNSFVSKIMYLMVMYLQWFVNMIYNFMTFIYNYMNKLMEKLYK